jgi:hypothetical protein
MEEWYMARQWSCATHVQTVFVWLSEQVLWLGLGLGGAGASGAPSYS